MKNRVVDAFLSLLICCSSFGADLSCVNDVCRIYSESKEELIGIHNELSNISPKVLSLDAKYNIEVNSLIHAKYLGPALTPERDINCWGTSMRIWEFTDRSRYIGANELSIILGSETIEEVPLSQVATGDIIVLFSDTNEPLHSVTLISHNIAIDKLGYRKDRGFRVGNKDTLFSGNYDSNINNRKLIAYRLIKNRKEALKELSPLSRSQVSAWAKQAESIREKAYALKARDTKLAKNYYFLVEKSISRVLDSNLSSTSEKNIVLANFLDIQDTLFYNSSGLQYIITPKYFWNSILNH
jgi:hypothetical protein